jgi:hypothetical protein
MTPDGNLADWDAAYILNALTPEERIEYERFLTADPARASTLTEFADIPAILDVLPREQALAMLENHPEATITGEAVDKVPSLAVAAEQRRKRSARARWGAALAAAAAFLLIGGIVGYTTIPHQPPAGVHLDAMAPGQRAGVTASLAVTKEEWGTRLDWECQYTKDWAQSVPSYDLVVTTKGGKETPVASWTPGGQASQASNLAAATTIPASEIRSVDIRVTGTTTPLAVTTLD